MGLMRFSGWNTGTRFWNTLFWGFAMEHELITCDTCNIAKPWMRFRLRLGSGMQKEVNTCSACRQKKASADSSTRIRKKKQQEKQAVLNRTHHDTQLKLDVPYYYPKLERQMRSYCNSKTAMDRKYLRDHQDESLNNHSHVAAKQQQAREHAKGWIALYDEICDHAINLLRQTGTRPPWAQLEGKADLHRLHGVYDTKRAQQLRLKG